MKCNGVVNSAYAVALAGGATVSLLVEESTYRKIYAGLNCSHVYQGTYLTLPGETGVSFQDTGTLGCTPGSCSLAAEFGAAESEAVCSTEIKSATTPLVTFRDEGTIHFMDMTYTSVDCDGGGVTSDTKVETYSL